MLFMDEYDIERAAQLLSDDPVMGPASRTLLNLMEYTNGHSDGWPYYAKPARSARQLMELVQAAMEYRCYGQPYNYQPPAASVVRRAYTPVRAFRTRSGWDFKLENLPTK